MVRPRAPSTATEHSMIRLGGLLAAAGLGLYGAMFVSFALTDGDILEAVGGFGVILVGLGVWAASRGFSRPP